MKTVKLKKPWFDLITSMCYSDIVNSYYGSCNLTASYLNNYSEKAINGFAADFLESLDNDDLFFEQFEKSEIIDNPDMILQYAANMLVCYLEYLDLVNNPIDLLPDSDWIDKGDERILVLKSSDGDYAIEITVVIDGE